MLGRRIHDAVRATKLRVQQRLGLVLYHPVQVVRRVELHGDPDYGGWCICPDGIDAHSVVYDVGVGEDISFAASLVASYGVRVWAFDPTPKSIEWFGLRGAPSQICFRPLGLSDIDGEATFYLPSNPNHVSGTLLADGQHQGGALNVPVTRLATVMADLGHRRVNILKLDIEGAEYAVLRDLLGCGLQVDQILVEFHHVRGYPRFAHARAAIEELNRHGYEIFAMRRGTDFSFIRTDTV